MAIEKAKTLENGASGNYWRILTITLDRQNLKARGQIALFKDKATSDAGKPHLGAVKTFTFDFTVSDLLAAANVISFMYGKIRTHAETMRSVDEISGEPIDPPVATDPDIAFGLMV